MEIIDDRQQFLECTNDILENNRNRYLKYNKLSKPQIKTYLVESNTDISKLILPEGYKIQKTESQDFFRLNTEKIENAGFVETSRQRIWKIYSMMDSKKSDDFIRKLVNNTRKLDNCWYTNQQFDAIEKKFDFRGLGIKYENFFPDDDETKNKLSLKMWTKGELLDYEEEIYNFTKKHFSKRSMRIQKKYEDEDRFLNSLYYYGKITTTHASNAEELLNFPNQLIDDYISLLKKIEENRGMLGSPVELIFEKNLPIKKMVEFFKMGKNPFKLWLTPIELKDDFVRLYGIDLHTEQKIGIDIGKKHIWINIPNNTCGNAGLRIPTLLSFSFPYKIKIKLSGEDLIA